MAVRPDADKFDAVAREILRDRDIPLAFVSSSDMSVEKVGSGPVLFRADLVIRLTDAEVQRFRNALA